MGFKLAALKTPFHKLLDQRGRDPLCRLSLRAFFDSNSNRISSLLVVGELFVTQPVPNWSG